MTFDETSPPQIIKDTLRDASKWGKIKPRNDDIIIATCYKSGTTLTQQIINLLLNGNQDFATMRDMSPWVESRQHAPKPEVIEALASPRFLKTHLDPGALPWLSEWKYIYLARDGRDVGLSLYNHCRAMEAEQAAMEQVDTKINGPANFTEFWDQWVETGSPRWDFWENIDRWWQVRSQPNVLLVHYNDLIHKKPTEVERIARFLDCEWNAEISNNVCKYSSIDYMRGLELTGKLGSSKKNKQKTGLVNKGINGRWKKLLTYQQLVRYKQIVTQQLEPACADWLHQGKITD